ncbi:hypothetical protein [Pseudomonas aeruginosa]|uniref:hypothetical protein n=1 Tax=Pseudomonas aeruginosa TaxID=287 RepID=UPI00128FA7F8|nr:hypothetical protein [Pseudomonas aeruginosa]MBA5035777.1 hypothetical protein [Pseudomonas aeruginosa]MBS9732735.1 hypothetical protein [Pseudomonas aeruginosa]MDA3170295.1 hypothetical protein [Pseudomonas aeruginosa]HBP1657380.1 hypothetical protein [Pseudomonas aeruginosa]HCE7949378.1 hypothetical protein [Pseudomonas aeruginosa]
MNAKENSDLIERLTKKQKQWLISLGGTYDLKIISPTASKVLIKLGLARDYRNADHITLTDRGEEVRKSILEFERTAS